MIFVIMVTIFDRIKIHIFFLSYQIENFEGKMKIFIKNIE